MWQHRQEERALKRAEMDVVKQRRNVERTMKKLNDGIILHNIVTHTTHPAYVGVFKEVLSIAANNYHCMFC